MNLIKKGFEWFQNLFKHQSQPSSKKSPARSLPPIVYPEIAVIAKPPSNAAVQKGIVYCVINNEKPKWSMFVCPCGCGETITLSVQDIHRPHWKLSRTTENLPTLHPSIWRDKGCLSHFWLKDGRVFWCSDTGTHPNLKQLH
jgi:hypothetical protein